MLGRRTQLQYPNGMTVAYAYDARGRLTDIHCRDAANVTLERYTYTFDGADNITQVVDAATAKWTYAYDDRYRLTQAERYLGAALKHRYTYTHDGADNAATQAVYNASAGTTNSIAYTYNAGNELTQAVSSANGTTSYAYDLWGRLTGITRGSQSAALGWAYQDRLKSYTTTLTGERSVNFAYTGDGRRMGVDNTLFGAKSWSYDGAWGVRTQSYASLPDSSRWYIQEPWGTVLAEAPVSGVVSDLRYYVRDHLGSTRSVRREDTTKFAWLEYDPYGARYDSGGWIGFVQDRFTGHEFDMETNMYWAPYRYYRPDMLRWASRDPLGMVDGPNVYGYVGGRSTQYTDSMGLERIPYADEPWVKKCVHLLKECQGNDKVKKGLDYANGRIFRDGDLGSAGMTGHLDSWLWPNMIIIDPLKPQSRDDSFIIGNDDLFRYNCETVAHEAIHLMQWFNKYEQEAETGGQDAVRDALKNLRDGKCRPHCE